MKRGAREEPSSQLRVLNVLGHRRLVALAELETDVARQQAHFRFSEEVHGISRSSSRIGACMRSFDCN